VTNMQMWRGKSVTKPVATFSHARLAGPDIHLVVGAGRPGLQPVSRGSCDDDSGVSTRTSSSHPGFTFL